MTNYRIHRILSRSKICSGSLTGLLLGWTGAGTMQAQTPSPAPMGTSVTATSESASPHRLYWKKVNIQLPIQINEKYRSMIREVQLYVKEQPAAPWTLRDKVGPDQKNFTFHADRDGEVAFAMVTVDKQGRSIPKDLQQEPPALVVVFDTQAPKIELTNLGVTDEGQMIQFDVHDANVDIARVRLYFQGGDKQFRPLEVHGGRNNVYCVPHQAVFTGILRATAEDLAGNLTTNEIHLTQLPITKAANSLQTSALTSPTLMHQEPANQPGSTPPKLLPDDVKFQIPLVSQDLLPEQKPSIVQEQKKETQNTHTSFRRPDGSEGPRFDNDVVKNDIVKNDAVKNDVVKTDAVKQVANVVLPLPVQPLPVLTTAKTSSKRHLVNQTRVYLDYQIENAGVTDISKVEVWATCDQGKKWFKHSEDFQGKSPVEVQLPEDGTYGICLVVTSKQGQAGQIPVSGDHPDWLIEVDTTKPTAQITNIETIQENGSPSVQITWTASDKNLDDNAVELFYSASPKGPWLPIAKGLKSDGQHRWTPPSTIGVQAFLRMTVRDQAGNQSITGTMEPIHFEGERPRAIIRSIRTEASIGTSTDSGKH